MPREIERKFLVRDASWRSSADAGTPMMQGYLCVDSGRTVRVRLAGPAAFLTIKGPADAAGVGRDEWEYAIAPEDARAMLERLCADGLVEKTRYRAPAAPGPGGAARAWEIDVFAGDNAGLVVAEIELGDEAEPFERPAWLGAEVSADPRFRNSTLSARPFSRWPADERAALARPR